MAAPYSSPHSPKNNPLYEGWTSKQYVAALVSLSIIEKYTLIGLVNIAGGDEIFVSDVLRIDVGIFDRATGKAGQ